MPFTSQPLAGMQADPSYYSLQEVFGGNATSDEYHIARHVANLFVVQTYEGQSDIHSEYHLVLLSFIDGD